MLDQRTAHSYLRGRHGGGGGAEVSAGGHHGRPRAGDGGGGGDGRLPGDLSAAEMVRGGCYWVGDGGDGRRGPKPYQRAAISAARGCAAFFRTLNPRGPGRLREWRLDYGVLWGRWKYLCAFLRVSPCRLLNLSIVINPTWSTWSRKPYYGVATGPPSFSSGYSAQVAKSSPTEPISSSSFFPYLTTPPMFVPTNFFGDVCSYQTPCD